MRCYQADGIVLVSFTEEEIELLENAADLMEELASVDGTLYVADNDDGEAYELNRLLEAAYKTDFTALRKA